MSILTDTDLKKIICNDERQLTESQILISPFEEKNLTPMSYDLRVGGLYRTYASKPLTVEPIKPGEQVTIKPGDTILIVTRETVEMPRDGSISALIVSKAKQVARGLSNISTKIDPGWAGELRVAVHNFSRETICLSYEEAFCSVIFIKNQSNSENKYRKRDSDPLGIAYKKELKIKEWAAKFAPIFIILIAVVLGCSVLKENPGFGPTLASGTAIAQIVFSIMRS